MPESERFHSFLRTEFSNLAIKLNKLNMNSDIMIHTFEEMNETLKEINNNLSQLVSLQSNKPCMNNTNSINNTLEEYNNNK